MTDLCPFCKIIENQDPDVREVYRDEHVIAFFPTEPATLGHTLVVPRRHVPTIWELSEDEATQLTQGAMRLAPLIKEALEPEGLNVIQSNGEAATQTVAHVHVHLVPRWTNDDMGPIWPDETHYSDSAKDEALGRLRALVRRGSSEPSPTLSPEDRRKHLDYIQAVVTRQSAASSAAKGWLLPVVTATYGFALAQRAWLLALLGIVAVVLFAYLDANYLRSERRFRALYDTVARSRRIVPHFTLDPADADGPPPPDASAQTRWRAFLQAYVPERAVWKSWSIAPFYVALLVLGIGVLAISATLKAPSPSAPATPSSPATQAPGLPTR